MATNQVKLSINPNWLSSPNGNVVLYAQAWHTSSFIQKVTITGPGLPEEGVIECSAEGSAYGSQFANFKTKMSYKPFPNWIYTVTIDYKNSDGIFVPSDVLGSKDFNILGHMVGAIALSNDAGSDNDFNDCVVQISVFKDSTDV